MNDVLMMLLKLLSDIEWMKFNNIEQQIELTMV